MTRILPARPLQIKPRGKSLNPGGRQGSVSEVVLIDYQGEPLVRRKTAVTIFLLISILAGGRSTADPGEKASARGRVIECTIGWRFESEGEVSKLRVLAWVPKTILGRQEIAAPEYTHEPERVFDVGSSRYALFSIDNPPRQLDVAMRFQVTLYSGDLTTVRNGRAEKLFASDRGSLREYVQPERFVESTSPEIIEAARGLIRDDELSTVRAAHSYTMTMLTYDKDLKRTIGALAALEAGSGDCSEYSSVFVALCRAAGIPAQVVVGYVVDWHTTPLHAWAEVYLEDLGWVQFDPTYADRGRYSFTNLGNVYLGLYEGHSDELLDGHPFSRYRYWGKGSVKRRSVFSVTDITRNPTGKVRQWPKEID